MSNGPPSRDRRSLQDLAKLASSPNLSPSSSRTPAPPSMRPSPPSSGRPSSPEHDSGIVDLKIIAKSDEAGAERAKTTPLASAGLFDDDMPSVAPPALSRTSDPPPSGKVPSSPPSSAQAQAAKAPGAAKAALAVPPSPPKGGGMLIPVLAGLGIAAVATCIFMMTRSPAAPPAPKAADAPAQAPVAANPAVEKSAPAPSPPPASPAPAAAPAPPVETTAGNETPKAVAGPVGARRMSGTGAKKAGAPADNGGGGSSVSELSAMMAHATNSPAAAAPVNPPSGNLGEAVQNAVGGGAAPTAAEAPAAPSGPQFAPGSVPEKPSQGAVTSALSQALPQARSCLNPDDPVSKANVTFGSTGGVTAVVVTGSAAGKPAEGCIKSALLKATVPPFAQATYSANVTVRPN